MKSHEVAISMVFPIMKTIVRMGFETEAFCKYASFDAGLLQDVEARINGQELERLMIAAAAFTGDQYFGLHQGETLDIEDMGVLGYVMMHSGHVGQALSAYQRYNVILSSQFNLDWEVQGDEVVIRLYLLPSGKLSRHCSEDMAVSLYRLMCRFTNRNLVLNDVQFVHDAPEDTNPFVNAFGILPKFGVKDHTLRLHKDVLDYPILYSDARLLGVFEAIAAETMLGLIQSEVFADQVVRWMKKSLPTSFPTLQQTAEAFGMSARTLQHKLKQEQSSYNDLIVLVRKEIAASYLRRTEYSVGDIAYALHYSEPSAFQNAFKKWTGMTPGQYRIKVREELTLSR